MSSSFIPDLVWNETDGLFPSFSAIISRDSKGIILPSASGSAGIEKIYLFVFSYFTIWFPVTGIENSSLPVKFNSYCVGGTALPAAVLCSDLM